MGDIIGHFHQLIHCPKCGKPILAAVAKARPEWTLVARCSKCGAIECKYDEVDKYEGKKP